MFSIDGVTYDGVLVSSLRRSFAIRDGKNSGTAQSGKTIRTSPAPILPMS